MAQITLYLDDMTQALVEQAAKAQGLSKSRWVADVIRKYAAHEWTQECLALLIAATAWRCQAVMVTRNVRECSRVPGLRCLN